MFVPRLHYYKLGYSYQMSIYHSVRLTGPELLRNLPQVQMNHTRIELLSSRLKNPITTLRHLLKTSKISRTIAQSSSPSNQCNNCLGKFTGYTKSLLLILKFEVQYTLVVTFGYLVYRQHRDSTLSIDNDRVPDIYYIS